VTYSGAYEDHKVLRCFLRRESLLKSTANEKILVIEMASSDDKYISYLLYLTDDSQT
jgi:hypothetical protein